MVDKSTHVILHKDGDVALSSNQQVTEKELYDERQKIMSDLDAIYHNVVDKMKPFQMLWASGPAMALAQATYDGATAGVSGWADDFADLFKEDTWKDMGNGVKDLAGNAWDTLASHAVKVKNDIQKSVNGLMDGSSDLLNWSWYAHAYESAQDDVDARLQATLASAKSAVKTAKADIEKAQKIYQHRKEILNLPTTIAQGDINGIQKFVDTTLADIDPKLAQSIREDKNFHLTIEMIRDHDTGLAFLNYITLCYEAIPPNFYVYLAAKGGAYLSVEILLTVIMSILTDGAYLLARVSMLTARLAASSAKVSKVIKAVEHVKEAFDAVIKMITDFLDIGKRLRAYAEKLLEARQRGKRAKGASKTTVEIEHDISKTRHPQCQCCGDASHHTPHHGKGVVVYQ